MKIVILIYSLGGGGAERVTSTLANEFVALGHEVEIGVLDGAIAPHYPLTAAVRVRDLALAGTSRSAFHSIWQLAKRVWFIRRWLRDSRADLAIGMMTASAVLLALARPGLDMRVIGSERVYPPEYRLPRMWEFLRRYAYGALDTVVVQTRATGHWISANTRAKDVTIIPNPVQRLQPVSGVMPSDVLPTGSRVIVSAGRLVQQKGFERLIDAFAKIDPGPENWQLVILGEGPLRDRIKDRAIRRGIESRFHLPGNVGNLGLWFDASDIYVLSSYFEGMPNTMLEAMAHGLPCIAFDISSGTREFLSDEHTGILVNEKQPNGLAEALTRLANDGQLRVKLGSAAAASVEANYTPNVIATEWVHLALPHHQDLHG